MEASSRTGVTSDTRLDCTGYLEQLSPGLPEPLCIPLPSAGGSRDKQGLKMEAILLQGLETVFLIVSNWIWFVCN